MNNPKIIQKKLDKFLDKSFFFSTRENNYSEELFLASSSNSYVETVEGKADSLHMKIKMCYWENFLEVYKKQIKNFVRKLNIRTGILAFDVTKEPFYGKTTNIYTIGCEPKDGYKQEFHFLVVSLINEKKEEKIPLLAFPVNYGFDFAKAIKESLEYAIKLFKVRFVLFDRGFYSVENIQTLEDSGIRYLILIPKQTKKIKFLSDTIEDYAHFYHEIKSCSTNTKTTTKIVLVRDESDKFTWSFATNMILENHFAYVKFYKKRWRIETNFRVQDQAKIKSKSVYPIIRYFYFLISLLLHAIWLTFKKEMPFKRFLIKIYQFIMLNNFRIKQIAQN